MIVIFRELFFHFVEVAKKFPQKFHFSLRLKDAKKLQELIPISLSFTFSIELRWLTL